VQNVLVTGGAGYIGSHTCKALAERGVCPIVYDSLCLGHRDFVQWGPLIEADIHDTPALIAAIKKYNVSGLIHFAAFAYVGESVTAPAKYYENNVCGMLSVLNAMRQTGLNRIVFSSSCAVYGVPPTTPISEQTRPDPINPYGRSKLMCEHILADFVTAYGLEAIALRYFNASGSEPSFGIGEKRAIETHLIPRAMMALQGHIKDFQIFGADYPTVDGTAVRDYIHVSDLAEAHIQALDHPLNAGQIRIFNLGVGKGYSVKEVLNTIASVSGRTMQGANGPRRPGDPAELIADASLAQKVLGFRARRSNIRAIIESAWQWHSIAHPLITSN
jgi:UDP-arabinose 4-epimerase